MNISNKWTNEWANENRNRLDKWINAIKDMWTKKQILAQKNVGLDIYLFP